MVAENFRLVRNLAQMFLCNAKLLNSFLVHIACIAGVQEYTKVSQYITAYGGKFFKINFDMVIVHKILQNLYTLLGWSRIFCLENECTLQKVCVYRGTQRNSKVSHCCLALHFMKFVHKTQIFKVCIL